MAQLKISMDVVLDDGTVDNSGSWTFNDSEEAVAAAAFEIVDSFRAKASERADKKLKAKKK